MALELRTRECVESGMHHVMLNGLIVESKELWIRTFLSRIRLA